MLHTISWMQCLGGITILTGGYYIVVMFRYFRKELWVLVRRLTRRRLESGTGPSEQE